MSSSFRPARRALTGAVLIGAAVASAVLAGGPANAAAAGATMALPQTGSFAVYGRGAGHGHGLSQYGAKGAAERGLSTNAILAFYYPHTERTVLSPSRIRVKLSGATANTTVLASTPGLRLCAHGALARTGVRYYRMVPSGSGLELQRLRVGASSWESVRTGGGPTGCFAGRNGWVQVLNADGSTTSYRGYIRTVRSGSGELTVNGVSLDDYAAGVTPREIPASWARNAVRAQAVAARTYGRYAVEHSGDSAYDICDTTSCQVYGGMAHYSAGGTLQWSDDQDAIVGNENTVLTYGGDTIFAQFSASNGGAEASGGSPYLPAKADPYDADGSGDPYLNWSRMTTASAVASYYGLKQATGIEITQRDGIGPWGGRVLSGYVDGVNWSGNKVRIATSGATLGGALGIWTTFFRIGTSG
jgi:peptidoglycan hydrolase-like amidase